MVFDSEWEDRAVNSHGKGDGRRMARSTPATLPSSSSPSMSFQASSLPLTVSAASTSTPTSTFTTTTTTTTTTITATTATIAPAASGGSTAAHVSPSRTSAATTMMARGEEHCGGEAREVVLQEGWRSPSDSSGGLAPMEDDDGPAHPFFPLLLSSSSSSSYSLSLSSSQAALLPEEPSSKHRKLMEGQSLAGYARVQAELPPQACESTFTTHYSPSLCSSSSSMPSLASCRQDGSTVVALRTPKGLSRYLVDLPGATVTTDLLLENSSSSVNCVSSFSVGKRRRCDGDGERMKGSSPSSRCYMDVGDEHPLEDLEGYPEGEDDEKATSLKNNGRTFKRSKT